MMPDTIFFKSDRFPPTQEEIEYGRKEGYENTVFAKRLADFLVSELGARGYVARAMNPDVTSLYGENCEYLSIEHQEPFDLGMFCGNYDDGHLLMILPEGKYAWKRFRRHHAEPTTQALQQTLLDTLSAADGITDVVLGYE